MPNEPTKEQAERAQAEFRRVLDASVPAYELGQQKLFHDDDENYIRREVDRKLYVPRLPDAGDQERKWLTRLKSMSYAEYWQERASAMPFVAGEGGKSVAWLCARAEAAAKALNALLPRDAYDYRGRPNPGQYYFWHALTSKNDRLGHQRLSALRAAAVEAREWEVKWFAEFLTGGLNQVGGTPEGMSDFRIEVLCGLRRWNGDVIRLVQMKNFLGEESKVLVLEAECFKSPEHFRAWCLKQGPFSWHGNQTQLQDLHWDTNRQIAWRVMHEVDAMGWHAIKRRTAEGTETWQSEQAGLLHGIWFYGDTAYYEGRALERDRDNVYTVGDEGYFLAEHGRESEYALGQPMMRPTMRLGDLLTLKDLEEFTHKPAPRAVADRLKGKEGKERKTRTSDWFDEAELMRAYFEEISQRLYDTVGSYEAYLAMGAVFAYAAAPEIFKRYGLFSGLWVAGQMESGKTVFTEWLMHLAGFNVSAGISALKSTAVGILQESQNYSNLVLWIDEFRQGQVGEDKVGIFRDAYNRQPPVKWNPAGIQRKIKTAFLISGESTSSDAATRSRYPHVQISASRRIKNHLTWCTKQKGNFFVFWRLLMERRTEFVRSVFQYLEEFVARPGTVSEREKMVHGIDWAGMRAMADLLGVKLALAFDDFVLDHMEHAAVDVTADTNINVFWTDLISAFNADAVPTDCFRIERADEATEYPSGRRWTSYVLFCEPNGMISALAAHLRKQGQSVSLRRNDLRDQLSKNPYWIPTIHGRAHKKRFGSGSAGGIQAWGFRLDDHPLGRQDVTEEEFKASLNGAPKSLNAEVTPFTFKDGDPRKGPLFAIVHELERLEEKKRRENEEEE